MGFIAGLWRKLVYKVYHVDSWLGSRCRVKRFDDGNMVKL